MKKLIGKIGEGPLFFKFDLKMKLTTFLLLITLLNVQANSFSQGDKVTLSMKDVTILEVIDAIESKTDFRFIYKLNEVKVDNKVSLEVTEEPLEKVLGILFINKGIEYKILDRQVILRRITSQEISTPVKMNQNQQQMVNGTVRDQNGVPLLGVNVLIKGAAIGTATDFDGFYELNVPDANAILVFSFIGYFNEEVSIDGQTTVDVVLRPNTQSLKEVVVQAYRNTTTQKNSAAISKVSAEVVENKPNVNVLNSLQARVPGLFVGSGNGQPGGDASVVIRGVGSINGEFEPLFVVDGTPVDSDDFRGINPNDIESVSVLKDAAASGAYGNRGANGVIVITTKKGRYDQALEITYSESYGRTYQPYKTRRSCTEYRLGKIYGKEQYYGQK